MFSPPSASVLPHACCWYAFVQGQDPAPVASSILLLLKGHKSEMVITAMKGSFGMNTPMPPYLVANEKLLYYNYNSCTISKVSAPTIVVILAKPQIQCIHRCTQWQFAKVHLLPVVTIKRNSV